MRNGPRASAIFANSLIKDTYGLDGSNVLAGSFHGTIDFGSGPLVVSGYDGYHKAGKMLPGNT
jgi:hypothetical protein